MVRKRTRKYESDDNDSDSDIDFDFEQQSKPAAKKYSLRERKRATVFTTDFDYYGLDEDDGEAKKQSSDDEDFEVEADVNGARSFFEPEPDVDPQNSEGLIDFEDIIRADIVVNRNKIDYDNIIQKTEIKLTQPKKRGRKPKNRSDSETQDNKDSTLVCEPELNSLASLENEENCEKTEQENGDKEQNEVNEEKKEEVESEAKNCEQVGLPSGEIFEKLEDDPEKVDDPDPLLKNTNSIEMVMLKAPPIQDIHKEEEKVEEEDDDVIVLGELEQDVIVLDD